MLKSYINTLQKPYIWGIFTLIMMLSFSLILRQQDFKKETGAQNLEASYHVLLTIAALNESPVKNHWYLPSLSLGREADKHIPWGETVPSKSGDYIYTSFTPLGFLAPYIWFKAFDLAPSKKNLARFNFFLGSIGAIILFSLLVDLLKYSGYSPWVSVAAAVLGSAISIFSREALLSHGIVYWSQSLYQLILIFSLYLFNKWLTSKTKEKSLFYSVAIIVATFVGALTEWSGYLFNIGLTLLLWIYRQDMINSRVLGIQVFIATIFAGLLTVIHFSLVVGYKAATDAFYGRFLARNTSIGSIDALIQGYSLSYGLFILTILSIIALFFFNNNRREIGNRQQTVFFIFVAACIPLIENFVMLQHATQFSFDRLKFIIPAALIFGFSFARNDIKGRAILFTLILISSYQGYKSYKADLSNYSSWNIIEKENRNLVLRVADKVDLKCAIISSNLGVRGYANLLFHRGIFEYKSLQDSIELMRNRNACASVYVEGTWAFSDLQNYAKATITHSNGSVEVIIK